MNKVTLRGTERVTTTYYFVGGQRVAMRQGETLTYLHGDHLGSASLATDASGAIVSVRLLQASSATPALQLLKMQRWPSGSPSNP